MLPAREAKRIQMIYRLPPHSDGDGKIVETYSPAQAGLLLCRRDAVVSAMAWNISSALAMTAIVTERGIIAKRDTPLGAAASP